jgi:cardiolipin synthase
MPALIAFLPPAVDSPVLFAIAVACMAFVALLLFLALFEPGLEYKIGRLPESTESREFLLVLEALTDAKLHPNSKVEVLTNGHRFYEAQLQAIAKAKRSVNLEAYIFQRGKLTRRFVEAMTERARAGVKVNVVIDAIGSFATWNRYFRELREAGGRIEWYHPLNWHTFPRLNNRTHRELLVVDGEVGFIGGAGYADHWVGDKKHKAWRDTVCRVEGEVVWSVQATFAENWLEASGEVLSGEEYLPLKKCTEGAMALVVNSTPSTGRSSRARILFQVLLATAKHSIHITTPYFLPDASARRELVRAVQRGVEVTVINPGRKSDHLLTRRSSRRLYGELLQAGVRIFEYRPAMIHAKVLLVDEKWSVVGSTNFDNRSFGLNDEVNLAALDAGLAARLEADFVADLKDSHEITYEEWRRRPLAERITESFGWLLERQQ